MVLGLVVVVVLGLVVVVVLGLVVVVVDVVVVDVVVVDVVVVVVGGDADAVPNVHVLAFEVSTVNCDTPFAVVFELTHGSGIAIGAPVHWGTAVPSRNTVTPAVCGILNTNDKGFVADPAGAVICARKPSMSYPAMLAPAPPLTMFTSPSTGDVTPTMSGLPTVGVTSGRSDTHVAPAAIGSPDGIHSEIGTGEMAIVPPVLPGTNFAAADGTTAVDVAVVDEPWSFDATTDNAYTLPLVRPSSEPWVAPAPTVTNAPPGDALRE